MTDFGAWYLLLLRDMHHAHAYSRTLSILVPPDELIDSDPAHISLIPIAPITVTACHTFPPHDRRDARGQFRATPPLNTAPRLDSSLFHACDI